MTDTPENLTGMADAAPTADAVVLLTGRCERRRHIMYQVVDTAGGLVIDAPLRAVIRDRRGWTPQRRMLAEGSASRYGCGCGRTSLVPDGILLADIGRGVTHRLEAAYTIGTS